MLRRLLPRLGLLLLCLACLSPAFGRGRTLEGAIRAVTSDPQVRSIQVPTPDQLQARMEVGVSLSMRNFTELQARLQRGENLVNGRITQAEWQERYLPTQADYDQLRAVLVAQGLTVVQDDANRTSIYLEASVAQIGRAFSVEFARVTTADGTFTSATTAPTLPDGAPDSTLGILGLQPHLRASHHVRRIRPELINAGSGSYLGPGDVKTEYSIGTKVTGSGQAIAIIIDGTVAASDLTTFWTNAGVTNSASNITQIPVSGGPQNPDEISQSEAALDVEYTSSIAPGATIRVYEIPSLTFSAMNRVLSTIIADKASYPISVVNMSFGAGEVAGASQELNTYTQTFAQVVANGITAVAAAGDDGSNPTTTTSDGYTSTGQTQVNYPASDPNVLAVGGTSILFKTSTPSGEKTWSEIPTSGPVSGTSYLATGGGVSTVFNQPTYQKSGSSLFTQYPNNRCLPDVAAAADGYSGSDFGAEIVVGGSPTGIGGTSLSAPLWSGVIALLNQARASAGLSTIGLAQPTLYTYAGSVLTDITSGTNGAYSAGTGYDLCTGWGTPNLTNLVSVFTNTLPTLSSQPSSATVTAGASASFAIAASGIPSPTYQWQRQPSGTSSWSNLSDGGSYSGSATATLTVASTTTTMSGDQFRCVVTNAFGSVPSNAATLTVNAAVTTTPASSGSGGGGGGGGGAPSFGFLAALAALAAARWGRRVRVGSQV